jgi:hypothetical protein
VGHLRARQVRYLTAVRSQLLMSRRITSLESNRPMLINETDCDMPLPSPVEDRYVQPQGFFRSHPNAAPYTGFSATIQITRLYASLYQTLKSSVISTQSLQSYDEQFRLKLLQLPEAYRARSSGALDPAALPPLFALLSSRYHLYRRNLAPMCHPADRAEAMNRCVSVAQDTAMYISRTRFHPMVKEGGKDWGVQMSQLASNSVCLHVWRCVLVLCFRSDYEAASVCAQFCVAVGAMRKLNMACGRNAAFVLDRLLDRIRAHALPQQLEHDEELVAYVSGDMQGSLEHAWVWAGAKLAPRSPALTWTSTSTSTSASTPTAASAAPTQLGGLQASQDQPMRDALPFRPQSISPSHGASDWDSWAHVERLLRQLVDERRPRTAQPVSAPAAYYPPPHNPVKRVQLGPGGEGARMGAPPSNTSRISIANII